MLVQIELTDKQVEFLKVQGIDILFHCCGQGMSNSDENEELQAFIEKSIRAVFEQHKEVE